MKTSAELAFLDDSPASVKMADLGKSTEGSKVSTVITTIALDADFPSSVAGASTEVPAILEDDKSDDGLKTADPERNASDDERQLVNGGVVIRDGMESQRASC